ncbi:MAG: hypothetical protein FWF08_09650, partial [Oscillospiraceae bacterium]|nr:hypothetical protein [Oscillospiraceae bacterium]
EDKMPWMLEHLKKEDIKEINGFDIGGSKEFAAGMGHMEYMAAALRENGLEGSVFVYPLDLQGAVDTAHLVCGDNIFYEFYDDPGFVHRLLALSREAIYFAMDECFKRMAQSNEIIPHYNYLVMPRESGGLKLSEDTTTLISPGQIDEFAKPHLRKILERFGGGYVHYCGKNDHLLDVLLKEPLVRGINLGNSEKHGMKEVLEKCRDNKKVYVAGIARFENESHYDFFTRILAPSYDAETGRFYVLPTYGCDISERGQVIGEFERAAENVKNHK